MAQLPTTPNDSLLLDLLRGEIRRSLKDDLMKVAEPIVDAAVDRAIAGMEMQIQRVFDHTHGDTMVRVLVERIRPKGGL